MSVRDRLNLYKKGAIPPPAQERGSIPGGMEIAPGVLKFTVLTPLQDIERAAGSEADYDFAPISRHHRFSAGLEADKLLFVDLETTSLSTGAGNYPFLAGLAFIRDGVFTTEQYFMLDYSAEPAMLETILPRFAGATLVTFNGRTFDIPLLKSRYRINRVPGFPVDAPHFDLLQPARRVFKRVIESCALKNIEERVLGIYREDDIPGWLIPEVYFSYQKHGETERLPLVIRHNRDDVQSMLALLLVLNRVYSHVENRRYDMVHRSSIAPIASALYRRDPEAFIDMVRYIGGDIFSDRALFKKYSSALKRAGRLDEAIEFWRKDGSVFSLEELAKHAEHRERDHGAALTLCASAMEMLNRGIFSGRGERLGKEHCEFLRERMRHRIARLRRKSGQ